MGITELFQNLQDDHRAPLMVLCDCDGTLFQTQKSGGINFNLFRHLIALKKAGHDVVIVSNEPNSNEARVRLISGKLAGDENFFAHDGFVVTPKSVFDGQSAFLAIDDDHTSHRVKAEHRWDPEDDELIADLKAFIDNQAGLFKGQGQVLTP